MLARRGPARYTGAMLLNIMRRSFLSARSLAAILLLSALVGCASFRFESYRESHFIDMDGQRLFVEYGKEKRTETLPNGLVCTFDLKVRVAMDDGKKIVLYQALATTGVRYLSEDKRYEFVEKGPYCIMRRDGRPFYEGVLCRK